MRWSMRTFHEPEARVRAATRINPAPGVVQVRSGRDAERLLARLAAG